MYDRGFRHAAVMLYRRLNSFRAVASLLEIAASTVWRWVTIGCNARGWPCGNGPTPKFTDQLKTFIVEIVARRPCSTQRDLADAIYNAFGVRMSRRLVSVALVRCGLTKKRARCRLQPARLASAEDQRRVFVAGLARAVRCNADIVAIDETGFDQRPRHTVYAYAPRGQRALVRGRPCVSRRHTSMIAAITNAGNGRRMFSTLTDGSVTSQTFASFLETLPCRRGTTIILDNASIHKTREIRTTAERRGFELLYLPPYSPELNPIEYVFSVVKRHFYRARYDAGSVAFEVHTAIDAACRAVSVATIDAVFARVRRLALTPHTTQ